MARTSAAALMTALAAVWVGLAAGARGQSVNLDISDQRGVPGSAYGGVGEAGFWNVWNVVNGQQSLRDLTGGVGTVRCAVSGAVNLQLLDHSPVTGDEGALMNEWLGLEGQGVMTLRFDGLRAGRYRVLTYAWHGGLDFLGPHTHVSVAGAMEGSQDSGGFWPGMQVLGTTYTEHTLDLAAGAPAVITVSQLEGFAGAVNGVQLVLVPGPSALGAVLGAGGCWAMRRRRSGCGGHRGTICSGDNSFAMRLAIARTRARVQHWSGRQVV